jgi:hypothetical protein
VDLAKRQELLLKSWEKKTFEVMFSDRVASFIAVSKYATNVNQKKEELKGVFLAKGLFSFQDWCSKVFRDKDVFKDTIPTTEKLIKQKVIRCT